MTQKIALGISEKIKTAYPEEKYKIYTEEVEQGYLKPCFFVLPSNINHKRMINNRFKSKYSFSIHYYPESDTEKRKECFDVLEVLRLILEFVKVGEDLIHGFNIDSKLENGVLKFNIDYILFTIRDFEEINSSNEPLMEVINIHG